MNAVDESMTLESLIPESESLETEDALDSIIYVDTTELRSVFKHGNKSDIHSMTTIAMDQNALESGNMNSSITLTFSDKRQTEPLSTPKGDVTKN